MQAVARKLYSEEEYWALEETSPFKNEFWDGEIVAISGGTFNHAEIARRIQTHRIINRLHSHLAKPRESHALPQNQWRLV